MNTDAFRSSGGSPPTDSATPAIDCTMSFAYRIRTAPHYAKPGRWIRPRKKFATLEAAESAARSAANHLAMRARCRAELELQAVVEWME